MTQSPTNPIHIGYSSLEDLLASSNGNPFYAMPIETSRPAARGLTRKDLSIRVSQVREDGVHHCEIRQAELLYMGPRPVHEERAKKVRARFNAAWEQVWDYLTQHAPDGVHQAAVAAPPDLALVGGWADCLNDLFTTKRKE